MLVGLDFVSCDPFVGIIKRSRTGRVMSVCIRAAMGCASLSLVQASSKDINSFFTGFGVSWIEWLNGVSVNVLFEDKFTATRALETLSQPIPTVPGAFCCSSCQHCRCVCERLNSVPVSVTFVQA